MLPSNVLPKLSVVVPVFNAQESIEKCAKSIANQTFFDYEVIFVDDGSTDKTALLLDSLKLQDDRVKVIFQENKGTGEARNTGINCAKGEFVCFMDSDDTAEPNMLEYLFMQMSEEVDITVCGFNEISESGSLREHTYDENVSDAEYFKSILSFQNASSVWAKLFRTELFKNKACLFPKGLRNNEDNATLYKLLHFARNVNFVSAPLYNWNRGIESKSRNINKLRIQETIDVLRQRKVFLQTHNIFNCNIEEYYSGVIYTLNLRKSQISKLVNLVEQAELMRCLYTCVLESNLIEKKELLLIRELDLFDYWRFVFFSSHQVQDKPISGYQQYFEKADWDYAITCSQSGTPPEINSLNYHLQDFAERIIYIYGVGDTWFELRKQLLSNAKVYGYIDQTFKDKPDASCFDLNSAMQSIPSHSVIVVASLAHSQSIVEKIQTHYLYNKRQPVLVTFAGVLVA